MSSSLPVAQEGQPSKSVWALVAPYVVPPVAASVAVVPVFRGLMAKSELQQGLPVSKVTVLQGWKAGVRAAPTLAPVVGLQMALQKGVESCFEYYGVKKNDLVPSLVSSAVVGALSSPVVVAFNGKTMGESFVQTLKNVSKKPCFAATVQETAFVAGLKLVDVFSPSVKQTFGDSKGVEYALAFMSGATTSLAGHGANTALTRWTAGLTVESVSQLSWGAARKARALGMFGVFYKLTKDHFSPPAEKS